MKLKIGRRQFTIDSYADASALWGAHRLRYAGASKAPRVHVIEDDGTRYYVSWNGKIWPRADANEWMCGDEPLYSPFAS